ncbi:MAG: arylsulfatase [Planctomycetaceae bacterium]|nr:arylsulfatase [Planctomycetaceae bacterium]
MLHRLSRQLVVCLTISLVTATIASSAQTPNIVFILTDDMGYGDPGCFNPDSQIPTPNIDRIAAEGMRLTDAHSPSSVCSPTRYALLTGRYAWRTKLQKGVLVSWSPPLISPERLTIGKLLQSQGYATGCFGKWHLGDVWPTKDGAPPVTNKDKSTNVDFTVPIAEGPTTRGFDTFFGNGAPNFPPYCFIENDHTVGVPNAPSGPEFNRQGPMLPGWRWVDVQPEITRRSVQFIRDAVARDPQQPFFLYMPLGGPHYPIVPTPEFQGRTPVGAYGDWVAQMDADVGQILNVLDETGVADNTLIVFTSDNGPEVTGEVKPGVYDRAEQYGHFSNGKLRGAKRDLWEGGHRVPFVIRWPGVIAPGSVSDALICHVDFMATVADVLDVELPGEAAVDSLSYLSVLRGESPTARDTLVHHSGSGRFAIRHDDWVLIEAPTGDDNGKLGETAWFRAERGYGEPDEQPKQLFNLAADPAQHLNLLASEATKAAELHDLLVEIVQRGRSTPGPDQANDVEVVIAK